MGNAASYIANNSPSEVAADIRNAISAQWDSLKADHAKAAAQGPEAEARWWGQTVGRIGFEVAATFVPVAGVAGKVANGARVADRASDVVRAGDKLADAAKGADKVSDGARVAESLLDRARRILGELPLNSKSLDDLYRAGKLNMDEARALAKSVEWKDAGGSWIYPPNEGFAAARRATTLTKGDQIIIDRYGSPRGQYASPLGESYSARALPPGTQNAEFHVYKIVDDVKVSVGRATPWFDEAGGAIQFKLEGRIQDLIDDEKLIELRR